MAKWTVNLTSNVVTALYFDEPSNACWFCTADGRLRTLRILGRTLNDLGGGWNTAIAVLPSVDGLTVFVVDTSGELLVVARDHANRADADPVLTIGTQVVAADRLGGGDILILDSSGRVHRVAPSAGAVTVLPATVTGANLLAVDEAADELVLGVSAATSQLQRFKLSDGSAIGTAAVIPFAVKAMMAGRGAQSLLLADAAGKVSAHKWSGSADPFTFSRAATTALCRWHSLIIAAAATTLDLVEWLDDVTTLPLTAGLDPLVPGGWAPIMVDYAAIGMAPNDVAWRVEEGPFAGTMSVARPLDQSPGQYEHRVIAGLGSPEFQVTAYRAAGGTVLATRRFRVVGRWPETEVGPPMSITGAQTVYAKPGWGGGSAGPQNINIHPAPEELRVAVAVFRTKGTNSTISAQQRVDALKADMVDPGRSVKTYFEEVSYRTTPASANPAHPKGTTVSLLGGQVFGPIDLPYAWADLFHRSDPDDQWSAWHPNGDTWDILGGTFSTHLLDRGLADEVTKRANSFVLTVLPGTDDPYKVGEKTWPAQWCWAFAGDAQIYWKGDTWSTFSRIPAVVMPAAMPANHPGPWSEDEYTSTIVHELGHNLGCPDLYGSFPAEIEVREVGSWDIMSSDVPLPHFSLANRMRLGWISPDWIEVCDFGQNPSSRSVILHAIEAIGRSGPPAGRRAGVEVRIREGWNYYFEYRRAQASQVGDRNLPVPGAIFGSDVFQAGADDIDRALILKLPNDVDGDGPELRANNSDYEESDVTNPDRMNDFRFTRKAQLPLDSNAVNVQIDYVGAHRPELQITPAPGRGEFKSPDISLDGPAGPNVAVKDKTNTIRVNVHNRGTKGADSVRIHVQWLPFTSAPGPWNLLPDPPTQPIPAHSTRQFVLNWTLPPSVQVNNKEAEHFCVRVNIDRYVDSSDPSGSEIVVHNNWAQSNFSTSAVGHSSPSERRTTTVSATNVLPMRAMHRTVVEQSGEVFRAFVDHAWRRLDPNETDVTELAYESLAGDPLHDRNFQIAFREHRDRGLTNNLTARTFVMPEPPLDGPLERWGVQLQVQAGIRTFIPRLDARGELVRGEVWAGEETSPQRVNSGTVRLAAWPARRPEEQVLVDGAVDSSGEFRLLLGNTLLTLARREAVLLAVYYHGTPIFTPCVSREIPLRF